MRRIILAPALLIAGPAAAHSLATAHTHDGSLLSLVLGLALIASGIGAAVVVRIRSK